MLKNWWHEIHLLEDEKSGEPHDAARQSRWMLTAFEPATSNQGEYRLKFVPGCLGRMDALGGSVKKPLKNFLRIGWLNWASETTARDFYAKNEKATISRERLVCWCRWPESNWRPSHYECAALPTELHRHTRAGIVQQSSIEDNSQAAADAARGRILTMMSMPSVTTPSGSLGRPVILKSAASISVKWPLTTL